ncbi:MAG: right-handed parallel beta-helix repeat-containing protein [Planctomycetaceae bacterium]|nr:right-handed parallel beta-helix repeat-containing protein [Planctomycetaceae bacterium]
MKTLLQKVFGKKKNTPLVSSKPRSHSHARRLHLEPLEERQMLSVTPADFNAIKTAYPDLNLSANMSDYNVIEITAAQLSDAALRDAINTAGTTTANDLIVVRTTQTQNKITLSGMELAINIDATQFGSVTIVSLGDEKLTIDADQQSQVFYNAPGSEVELAGLIITHGIDIAIGGGIYNEGTLTITNCMITGNTAFLGGGIYGGGNGILMVIDSVISENTADHSGGGIYTYPDNKLIVTNCVISDNTADSSGGGIYGSGTMTITNSVITKNFAGNHAGGIMNDGFLAMTNCEVSENTAWNQGGGIYNGGDNMTLANCLIFGNSSVGYGGGIYHLNSRATVTNCTITGNQQGGISVSYSSGTCILYNTIVTGNSYSNITSGGYATVTGSNNLTDFTGWASGSGNNIDPFYSNGAPLFLDAANGDYRLARYSQAINSGNNQYAIDAGLDENSLDMAGNPRFVGVSIDIGACEFYFEGIENETHSAIITTLDDIVDPFDGKISLREAIAYATTGDTITFAKELWGQTITLNGSQLFINKNINIDATGANITIDGNRKSHVFYIAEDTVVVLEGLVITKGRAFTGGGIFNLGSLTLMNCVITGNGDPDTCEYGGGICNYLSGTLTVMNCTISENTALRGGGIFSFGTTFLYNTVVAKNSSDINCLSGTVTVQGYANLSTFTGWNTGTSGENYLYNPDLPLFVDAANGDYRLAKGSQAVDKGSNDYVTTEFDLDGNPRIVNGTVDIGAYEWSAILTMPASGKQNHWTARRNNDQLEILDTDNKETIETYPLDLSGRLTINSSGTADDTLTIDFSYGGAFLLTDGIQFNGHATTLDTLAFLGTNGDDTVFYNGLENRFNGLSVFTQDVGNFTMDGGAGNDQAFVNGTKCTDSFRVADNFFVMEGGGYHLELRNFNSVDAFASGRKDKTYIYGEKNSLIVMNDRFVERRAQNQTYRIWNSEQVIAIDLDGMNAILHTGSNGLDRYTLASGYGTVTNAAGSYQHEFVNFKNVNISSPMSTPTVSLPTGSGYVRQTDRAIWTQNGFTVTMTGNANVITRDNSALSMQATAKVAPSFANDTWDENLLAFLADMQVREQHKNDNFFDEEEIGDWLAGFKELKL